MPTTPLEMISLIALVAALIFAARAIRLSVRWTLSLAILQLLFICTTFITFISNAHALDCKLLAPRGGVEISEDIKGAIDGRVQGVIGRILGAQAGFQGEYSRIEKDILNQYPNADRLYIWERIIFGFCQSLSESRISDKEQLDQWIRLLELYQLGPPKQGASALEKLRSSVASLQSAIERTDEYVARLKIYPEKYNREGELFNTPICYAEIAQDDTFANRKDSLFPSAAYTLLGTDNPELAHLELYDRIHEVMKSIRQANTHPFLNCGPRIRACARCRPSNLLSAYLYKLFLRNALLLTDFQIKTMEGHYKGDMGRAGVDRQLHGLECDFLREVRNSVPTVFVPRPIATAISGLDQRCNS